MSYNRERRPKKVNLITKSPSRSYNLFCNQRKITTYDKVKYRHGNKQIGEWSTGKPNKGRNLIMFMTTILVNTCVKTKLYIKLQGTHLYISL